MKEVLNKWNWKWMTILVFTILFSTTSLSQNSNAYDSVAQIFDSSYGQNGQSTTISMNFSAQSFVQEAFKHNSTSNNNKLYVNEDGMYKISYSCVWNATSGGSTRRIYRNFLKYNGTTDVIPSKSVVYIRGDDSGSQAGGHTSSTSATVLVNMTNGTYIELKGGEDPGDTGNGNTYTRDSCFISAQKLNTRSIEVYDNTGGQNIQSGPVIVNLDTTYYNGDASLYELNNNKVNVSENGWYKLSYTSCIDAIVDSNRQSPQSWIRKNGNENISLSFSFAGYIRDAQPDRDRNCNRATTLVNLTSGDYIELQTGIYNREKAAQVETMKNQSWLLIEKIDVDSTIVSINNSGQQINHGDTNPITFDLNDKIGEHITHAGSDSKIYFDKSGLYELAYNIGYQDYAGAERIITCGKIRKNGNTNLSPSKQCIYTRADAQARTGTISTTSIINVSKDDYIEIIINVEGELAGSDGENIQIQKGTTWFTVIKINETPKLTWDATSLDIGDTNVSQGNISNTQTLTVQGEGHNNVSVTCTSGDCGNITDNWNNGDNISFTLDTQTISFTCSDDTVGSYNADFKINSTQDGTGDTLTVTCDVNQTYGWISVALDTPAADSYQSVFQNKTFTLNGTITCDGPTSSICGNVSAYSRYNNSASTFININTSTGEKPLNTLSAMPQSCVLAKGELCNVEWTVNATGNLGTELKLNINISSNQSLVLGNISSNTTINISQLPPDAILWQATTLSLGTGGLNLGNLAGSTQAIASGNHTNIQTYCNDGNCSLISDNWIDGNGLNDTNKSTITFSCDDGLVGDFWAVFDINSTEDSIPMSINVSCEITQTYGYLNITLDNPPQNQNTQIKSYKTFDINATIICEGTPGASCGTVKGQPRYSQKTLNYGTGSEGVLTVSSTNTIINNYTYLTGNELKGELNITVNDTSEFATGDEILIIQMQDYSGTGTAGNYEFRNISNINGNIITLESNLTQNYGSGSFDSTSASTTQIVKVLHYTNITINSGASITAPAWNGYSGGIVAFRATAFFVSDGYVNVSQKGFRGGDCNGCANNAFGDQGEGTDGLGVTSTGANENGGGGGDGSAGDGSPGGGGGYGTAGTGGNDDGTYDSSGGNAKGQVNLSKIYFGGGAGAGGDNLGRTPFPQNVDGAGIAMIFAKYIENAKIHAIGEEGIFGSSASDGGVSGSGAGGTIWLGGNTINMSDVNASGGSAVSGSNGDIGGAGGDGRIRLDYLGIMGNSSPSSNYNTSETFQQTMVEITNITGELPFYILGSKLNTCQTSIFQGETCKLNWLANVSSITEISYFIDVNGSSDKSQVPNNESQDANVTVDAEPFVEIVTPTNNSKYFDTQTITAEIDSNLALKYVAFYINNNLSNETTMTATDATNKTWTYDITGLTKNNYNITFVYNATIYEQNTTKTHYFNVLNNEHKRISKKVISQSTDTYLANINVKNVLNKSEDIIVTDFINQNFSVGVVVPLQDFINVTNGPNYYGNIYGWNLTVLPLSINEINVTIGRNGPTEDYFLAKAFTLGLD